eukprot:9248487-Lingulodinium_polyedra.AAC.1
MALAAHIRARHSERSLPVLTDHGYKPVPVVLEHVCGQVECVPTCVQGLRGRALPHRCVAVGLASPRATLAWVP